MASSDDKETIARLRDALANMNQDYMQTKLELESMKQQPQSQQQATSKTENGSSFLKLSSKVKALQSNLNTKLQTAANQINNLNRLTNEEEIDTSPLALDSSGNAASNGNCPDDAHRDSILDGAQSKTVDKENRRLRDDIESLQTQMDQLRLMLKQSMEEKDQLQKERNELLMRCGGADEEIKKLKRQSAEDSHRYEQLLNQFALEKAEQIESAKKKLHKEHDTKLEALSGQCQEYKRQFEELQGRWKQNEEEWNHKFDLVVSERNKLKSRCKSLRSDLSDFISKNDKNGTHSESAVGRKIRSSSLSSTGSMEEADGANESKLDTLRVEEVKRLKAEIDEMTKSHKNEKMALLQSIQRLSSQSATQRSGSDMHSLVNSLSTLISEKEEQIACLAESKRFLGHRLLTVERELQSLKSK